MRQILIVTGLLLVLVGAAWPLLERLPLGRLPGDIFISRPGLRLFFPITTMLIVSIIISLVLWLFRR